MKRSGTDLKNLDPRTWEKPYRGAVHALVILGDWDISRVDRLVAGVRKGLKGFAQVVAVERGREWRNADKQVVDHFGYADGLRQPRFLKNEIDRQKKSRDGTGAWNPSAPLSLVLARDSIARGVDAFGNYLVFRKLDENVSAFNRREKDMARALGLFRPDAGLAGALMVARFRDGTPVTLSPVPGISAPSPSPLHVFRAAHRTSVRVVAAEGQRAGRRPRGSAHRPGIGRRRGGRADALRAAPASALSCTRVTTRRARGDLGDAEGRGVLLCSEPAVPEAAVGLARTRRAAQARRFRPCAARRGAS